MVTLATSWPNPLPRLNQCKSPSIKTWSLSTNGVPEFPVQRFGNAQYHRKFSAVLRPWTRSRDVRNSASFKVMGVRLFRWRNELVQAAITSYAPPSSLHCPIAEPYRRPLLLILFQRTCVHDPYRKTFESPSKNSPHMHLFRKRLNISKDLLPPECQQCGILRPRMFFLLSQSLVP